jgi:all-trans-retinol 13,14-reductase
MQNTIMDTHWDTIVIGSGMGGMSCANALARTGEKVLVLEQHYLAGGMTHTFQRKGFLWDVGVHAMGEMSPKRLPGKLVRWMSDGKLEMNNYGKVYDTFNFPGGMKFELPDSRHQFRQNLIQAFPQEVAAIDRYLELVNQVGKTARSHFTCRNLAPWGEKVLRPLIARQFDHWAGKTTSEVINQLTNNPQLRAVLVGQWGYYGLPPSQSSFFIHAVTVRHFWEGGYYPKGSAKVMAETLLNPVKERGGAVELRCEVSHYLMHKDQVIGVVTKKGEELRAKRVVSSIGARTSLYLLPPQYRDQKWCQQIEALPQGPAHVCLYIGVEGDVRAAGGTESNQWFFETWDYEKCFWNVDKNETEAPVLYTSFPSLKDPEHDAGPKQKHTVEVVTFAPYESFKQWDQTRWGKRPEEYQAFKDKLEGQMLAQLWKHLPKLKDISVYHEFSTPLSTVHYCRTLHGAIYGLAPTPERFKCQALRPKTPIKGLYLSGQDIGTLGVVGAMMGGFLTAAHLRPTLFKQLMQ